MAGAAGVADNAPHDQGQMGTCVVHALVTVMAQRLMLKYNKVLDEADAISAIKRAARALDGSHVVAVVETVNTLTEQDGLGTMGSEEVLELQVTHGGRVDDFGRLCALMEERQGEAVAQAVVVIQTGVSGHGRHAVAAEGVGAAAGGGDGQSVRCKNSWGPTIPYFDVTPAGGPAAHEAPYKYHVEVQDVTIANVWVYKNGQLEERPVPVVLPRYAALRRGNQEKARAAAELRREKSTARRQAEEANAERDQANAERDAALDRIKELERKLTNETIREAVRAFCEEHGGAEHADFLHSPKTEARYGPVSEWDVSRVTDMSYLFSDCKAFNQPLGKWQVGQVTNMSRMFEGAAAFDQPLGEWQVSQVTDMSCMFDSAAAFNQPLGEWQVGHVTDMRGMFAGAAAFNQPLEEWQVGHVTDMSYMFRGAAAFNQPLGEWQVGQVTDMCHMFRGAAAFDQPLGEWQVGHVTDMSCMFDGAAAFNQPLGEWQVGQVTDMRRMF
eukprot:COSAG01_NODE_9571_length_2406_cov_4.430429_2_plen_498_part_00